jgi:hypothetical protein
MSDTSALIRLALKVRRQKTDLPHAVQSITFCLGTSERGAG